jgi:ADP compounds hydrolase
MDMKLKLPEKEKPSILGVESLISTDIIKIEKVKLKFSNGVQREYQRFAQWPNGIIMVIPMLDDETMLLIREYCAGIEDYALTLPKGKVDANELPVDAANRELQEEIGYGSKNLILLRSMTQSPSYSSTLMHMYLATDLYESRLEGDEPEPLDVVPWKIKDIDKLIEHDDFHEGRAIAGLFMAAKYLGKL